MFRRLRSPLAPALAALALTTMLVACGGDDDAGSSGSTATTVASEDIVSAMFRVQRNFLP